MTIQITDLLSAGVHFGHQKRHWNPQMSRYIFGTRKRIHIIDIRQTLDALNEAVAKVAEAAATNKKILFVGTKLAATKIIKEQAKKAQVSYINHRWLGGTLTNYKTINASINAYNNLLRKREEGVFKKFTKKEALKMTVKMDKLERSIGGIREMSGYPDLMFIVDVNYEDIAVKEAQKLGIPVIGIVDTNSNPKGINCVIPGNDDAMSSISLITTALTEAIITAKVENGFFKTEDDGKRSKRRVVAKNNGTEDAPAEVKPQEDGAQKKAEVSAESEPIATEPTANATVAETPVEQAEEQTSAQKGSSDIKKT